MLVATIYGQGKIAESQGKVREKSREFLFPDPVGILIVDYLFVIQYLDVQVIKRVLFISEHERAQSDQRYSLAVVYIWSKNNLKVWTWFVITTILLLDEHCETRRIVANCLDIECYAHTPRFKNKQYGFWQYSFRYISCGHKAIWK